MIKVNFKPTGNRRSSAAVGPNPIVNMLVLIVPGPILKPAAVKPLLEPKVPVQDLLLLRILGQPNVRRRAPPLKRDIAADHLLQVHPIDSDLLFGHVPVQRAPGLLICDLPL